MHSSWGEERAITRWLPKRPPALRSGGRGGNGDHHSCTHRPRERRQHHAHACKGCGGCDDGGWCERHDRCSVAHSPARGQRALRGLSGSAPPSLPIAERFATLFIAVSACFISASGYFYSKTRRNWPPGAHHRNRIKRAAHGAQCTARAARCVVQVRTLGAPGAGLNPRALRLCLHLQRQHMRRAHRHAPAAACAAGGVNGGQGFGRHGVQGGGGHIPAAVQRRQPPRRP